MTNTQKEQSETHDIKLIGGNQTKPENYMWAQI